MNISSVAGVAPLATNANNTKTNDAVDIAVLNKALNAQVKSAAALIQSVAESPQPSALPDNVGTQLNVKA